MWIKARNSFADKSGAVAKFDTAARAFQQHSLNLKLR